MALDVLCAEDDRRQPGPCWDVEDRMHLLSMNDVVLPLVELLMDDLLECFVGVAKDRYRLPRELCPDH